MICLLCEFFWVDDKGCAFGTVGVFVAFEEVLVALLPTEDNDDTFVIEFVLDGFNNIIIQSTIGNYHVPGPMEF